MHLWNTLLCWSHLVSNTEWEFFQRNFTLSENQVLNLWKRSLTTDLTESWQKDYESILHYENIAQAAEYTALVYCPGPSLKSMINVGRLGNFQLEHQGRDQRQSHHWILNRSWGYFFLTLRGTTNNPAEIWNDLDFHGVPLPCAYFPIGCRRKKIKVHHGFLNHFFLIAEQVTNLMNVYQYYNPNFPIIVTAHSLGSATASLLLLHWIETRKVNFHAAYLFGTPRVGNFYLGQHFSDDRIINIINENDIVPSLGYYHGIHPFVKNIWSRNGSLMSIKNYTKIPCTNLSWEHHSEFNHIPISAEYCKLRPHVTKKIIIIHHWQYCILSMLTVIALVLFGFVTYQLKRLAQKQRDEDKYRLESYL